MLRLFCQKNDQLFFDRDAPTISARSRHYHASAVILLNSLNMSHNYQTELLLLHLTWFISITQQRINFRTWFTPRLIFTGKRP